MTTYIVNVEGAVLHEGRYLMIVRGTEETHAAGTLSLVGGKVEVTERCDDVLETTLRREIWEEVGVVVGEIAYVHSTHFVADSGNLVVDVVFICRYEYGEPVIDDPGEVAEFLWLTAKEISKHPKTPTWTRSSIQHAERVRTRLRW